MTKYSVNFLEDSLTHHYGLRNALDQKASILLALSGVIFSLSIGHFPETQFITLAISSFLAALLSVLAIFLPFRSKTRVKFNLMCWWGFSDRSFAQYKEELNKLFASDEKISQEYMKEIWNLANYSLKPKTNLLKWASLILIIGLLSGFILFFI